MKIKKKELSALLEGVWHQAFVIGSNNALMDERINRLNGELNGAREEHRILKLAADQAEAKAAALKTKLNDERAAMEKMENTLSKFARHNKMLHDMLEGAGVHAPTYAQFISGKEAEAALEVEEGEE